MLTHQPHRPVTDSGIDLLRPDKHPSNSKGCGIKPGALQVSASRCPTCVPEGPHDQPDGMRADSARRSERVLAALDALLCNDQDITASALARAARVDRTFPYRHRDLLERVHAAATAPPHEGRITTASRVSIQTDLANALERNRRLASRVQQLEKRLSTMLGEAAWNETGLGAAPDIDNLQQRITMLDQELNATRGQLCERTEELEAARVANRELTRALNQRT